MSKNGPDMCIRCDTQEYVKNGHFVPAGRMRDPGGGGGGGVDIR